MPMTESERADYERAAVALETHEWLSDANGVLLEYPWAVVAWKAWDKCNEEMGRGSVEEVDRRAARLLRECIERGEPLP